MAKTSCPEVELRVSIKSAQKAENCKFLSFSFCNSYFWLRYTQYITLGDAIDFFLDKQNQVSLTDVKCNFRNDHRLNVLR